MKKSWFIAGTDTDVGKTYVGCLLVRAFVDAGQSVGVYKPVASGFPDIAGSDGERLWIASNQTGSIDMVSPQRFIAPFAPPIAARMENKYVDQSRILAGYRDWQGHCDVLFVEGAGGLMSPISDEWTNADLIRHIDCEVILVANWKLGVVNQVLTTLVASQSLGIRITMVVLNTVSPSEAQPDPTHVELLQSHLGRRPEWASLPVLTIGYKQTSLPLAKLPFAGLNS